MPYRMHPKQLEKVLQMSSRERYEHFISKVADWEELWVLTTIDDTLLTVEADDLEYLPVWPHPDYAEKYCHQLDLEVSPARVELDVFMDQMLVEFDNKEVKIGIFPNLEVTVWIMEPKDLLVDIKEECALYE